MGKPRRKPYTAKTYAGSEALDYQFKHFCQQLNHRNTMLGNAQSIFHDQAHFMLAGKQTVGLPNCKQLILYGDLIEEEFEEFDEVFCDASLKPRFENAEFELTAELVKEVADVLVVASGFLVTSLGPDRALEIWNAVHQSNLLKTVGGAEHREDGKILKNAEYKKSLKERLMADLEQIIRR